MPFDRLVRAVDEWAGERGRDDIFAQIGETAYRPEHIGYAAQVDPAQFRELVANAEAVVAHAGTGTILTALELGTPVLVMPRHGALMETRNDHQIATAERFRAMDRVEVAMDEAELVVRLDHLADLPARGLISTTASDGLIEAIRGFISGSIPPIRE